MQELLAWTSGRSFAEATLFALLANLLVFAAALMFGAALERAFRHRRVADVPPPLAREEVVLAASCVVLNSVVMLGGWSLFREGLLTVDGTTAGSRWISDALVLGLLMDFGMYVTHRVAHLEPFFRRIHGVHHRYEHPRPLTLFVLHPIEVLGFGALWIAILCTHAFSLGGMLIYLTVNVLFGVVGHIGVEPLPKGWARWPLVCRLGTSTFHAHHHQRPRTNFGFYTGLWDRLFGTLDPDYEARFASKPR